MRSVLGLILSASFIFAQDFCKLEFDNGFSISKLPLADTNELRTKGLSNKTDIGEGMLFVWGEPVMAAFWMKDTRVALSIGFFDEKTELFQIEDMEPYDLTPHPSAKKFIFALELKKGDFQKHNITIGTKIKNLKCE